MSAYPCASWIRHNRSLLIVVDFSMCRGEQPRAASGVYKIRNHARNLYSKNNHRRRRDPHTRKMHFTLFCLAQNFWISGKYMRTDVYMAERVVKRARCGDWWYSRPLTCNCPCAAIFSHVHHVRRSLDHIPYTGGYNAGVILHALQTHSSRAAGDFGNVICSGRVPKDIGYRDVQTSKIWWRKIFLIQRGLWSDEQGLIFCVVVTNQMWVHGVMRTFVARYHGRDRLGPIGYRPWW